MAKKQMSFAEKSAKHKAREWKAIKYVKSERSKKTGNWRFNESLVHLAPNENLDQALARMKKEVEEMAKEMASIEDAAHDAKETAPEINDEAKVEETKAEAVEEHKEKTDAKEEKVEETEVKTEADKPEKDLMKEDKIDEAPQEEKSEE